MNVYKTVFMVFTSARTKYNANVVDNRILLNDKPLQQVSTTKFLEVKAYINEHLNCADYIHYVKSKISKTCGILTKLKYLLPPYVLLTIYNTQCLPCLQYVL